MKRVSTTLFLSVMWKGICQVCEAFFGLFGFKRNGWFVHCVWGLFATGAAAIVVMVAGLFGCALYEEWYDKYYKEAHCYNPSCYYANRISEHVFYHEVNDGDGYVYNALTGEKTLKDIRWIAEPEGNDSLVCFNNGKKRGYFNKFTGEVVVEPKYTHAWVFSEGLASVEEGGTIKFIDATGKVVIDSKLKYVPNQSNYLFHDGYCIVRSDDGEKVGLMDKKGRMVLPMEYSSIDFSDNAALWSVQKGKKMGVFDHNLRPVIPLMECSVYMNNGTIDVTLPDHIIKKYDYEGKLIHDFYICSYRMLEYEKEEMENRLHTEGEEDDEEVTIVEGTYHLKATARLRAYSAGDSYEGLITADGHIVTMPLYENIEAIGPDLYLCTWSNCDKVIVNGKGEIVK